MALLAYAADQFVLGAARVAILRRVPTLVVGVLIVGFGTSAPELLVSTIAAGRGEPEIAVGNILGSNVANLSLLLGIGALVVPLSVDSLTVRREAPMTVGAMVVFALFVQGDGISVPEGLVLLALMAASLYLVTRRSPGDPLGPETEELVDATGHRLGVESIRTVLGLVGTVAGAQLLLLGALDVADRLGLGEGFVGATLVAVGTSLPELVTVIQSARRGETDLIVGNLLGSNLFNALLVGGGVGLVSSAPLDAPELTSVAAIAAVVIAGLAAAAMWTAHTVTRGEGLALVLAYTALLPFLA